MTSQTLLALFGSIGTWEAVLIGMVALLLFGNRLPEVMRSLGRGVIEFKKGLKDTQDTIERAASEDPPPPRTPQPPAQPSLPPPAEHADEHAAREKFLAGTSDGASTSL